MKNLVKLLMVFILLQANLVFADNLSSLSISAVMTPKEQILLDINDGTGHYVLMVKREGQSTGSGLLAGASVTEYGRHDVTPGLNGNPSGYLVFAKGEGNVAYIKWTVRTIYLTGKDGIPQMNDNGFWEVVSGIGSFKGMKGAGILHIRLAPIPSDRIFSLEGKITVPQ